PKNDDTTPLGIEVLVGTPSDSTSSPLVSPNEMPNGGSGNSSCFSWPSLKRKTLWRTLGCLVRPPCIPAGRLNERSKPSDLKITACDPPLGLRTRWSGNRPRSNETAVESIGSPKRG